MSKINVHGGIELLGAENEVQNLNLEKLPVDPLPETIGRIWANVTDKKLSYVESTEIDGVIRKIAHDGDIAALNAAISLKADNVEVESLAHVTVTNVTTDDMLLGQPVFSHSNLEAGFANAGDVNKKKVIGLVSDDVIISNNGSGKVLTSGLLTGTVAQWEFVTGMVGGLVPDTKYFLDTVSGKLTIFPPTADGQYICLIGTALNSTVFLIRIERPITI